MNRNLLILLCVFILSRIIFINPLPVFFDSPEYLDRFSNPNIYKAIVSGHMPFHIAYIALFWPIFHFAKLLLINPPLAIIIAQIILSTIAVYFFYRSIKIITNEKIAYIATAIGISLPLYWITNVSIMPESTCINFFLISLFFLVSYAKMKNSVHYLILGSISFGLSLLVHPLAILWLPFLLSIAYLFKKEKTIKIFFAIIVTFFLTIIINGFILANVLRTPFLNGIFQYLFGEDLKVLPEISSLLMILRFIRNAFIPILQNNTIAILILAYISLVKIFKINKKLFIACVLWIFPSIIVNQWFNPLLSGRHGIIAEFGFAFLAGIILEKRKILFTLILAYILITFFPAMLLLRQPIPYLTEQKFIKNLPSGLLIETHLARPQIQGNFRGEIYFVNEPGKKEKLEIVIDRYLKNNKPVFITSQALSDPYGLYSGPFLLPLSLSYAKKFELKDTISSYSTQIYAVIDKNAGLTIYKVLSKNKSQYPNIPILKYNRRRIDYSDPMAQLWFLIERANIIQIHNIIKE